MREWPLNLLALSTELPESNYSVGGNKSGNQRSFASLHLLADAAALNSEACTPLELGLESRFDEGLLTLASACERKQIEQQFLKTSSVTEATTQTTTSAEYYIECLEKELKECKKKEINASNIKSDKQKLKYYTGFVNAELFDICFDFITYGQFTEEEAYKLPLTGQFLLVLMRLRLGLTEQNLAYTFSISKMTVSRIFLRWIPLMFRRFKLLNIWPSRQQIINTIPMSIAMEHPRLRVINDCTEIKISQPKGPANQQINFSSYKNCNTAKALLGISPTGAISFVSEFY